MTDASGAVVLKLSVDAITPDVACTSLDAGAAGNDHLIALVVRVIPVVPQALDVAGFGLLNADGSFGAVDTVPATSCLPDAGAIPAGLLATGQEYVGTVVLDAPVTAGTIVYRHGDAISGVSWRL